MPDHLFLYGLSPLYLAQAALTIWMLVDAHRRGVEFYWYWIILAFQPLGAWAYFGLHKLKDLQTDRGWLAGLFQRKASLQELRYRAEQSPTAANRLELGERLAEAGTYAEALPHLEAVLAREPEHCRALFVLARCQRGLEHPEQAAIVLRKLVARQPGWSDYQALRTLIEVSGEAGDQSGALVHCRDLARHMPSLRHKCLLAEHLLEAGDSVEARKVLEQGLADYRYLTGPSRRRDRGSVGKAKQLLREIGTGDENAEERLGKSP